MSIFEKIQGMIADELSLQKDSIKLESRLAEDLAIDSIDAVQLVMELENEFGITISDDELKNLKTVKDLVDCIEKQK